MVNKIIQAPAATNSRKRPVVKRAAKSPAKSPAKDAVKSAKGAKGATPVRTASKTREPVALDPNWRAAALEAVKPIHGYYNEDHTENPNGVFDYEEASVEARQQDEMMLAGYVLPCIRDGHYDLILVECIDAMRDRLAALHKAELASNGTSTATKIIGPKGSK